MRTRFLIFLSIVIIAEVYSFIAVRSAIRPLTPGWRTFITILYVTVTIFTWVGFVFFRVLNWAEMPHLIRNIYIAFTMGFWVGKILVAAVMAIDDLRRLFMWVISMFLTASADKTQPDLGYGAGITRSVFLKRVALILGGTAVAGFLYGITNRYNYQIKRIKLSFDNLPAAFKGLKIVQISDIHSGSFDSHGAVARGAELVMEQKPDIIFFTGDLVNNKADEIQPYTDIFSGLNAPLGVYSTLGNHDYGDYVQWPTPEDKHNNLERLKQTHADMGWKLMMNEHVVLERGNDKIAVVGIENWGAKAGFPKYGDMRQAYSGLNEQDVPFKILLSHDPSHWSAEVTKEYKDIDLTLSGHTHGMQFGIEIPGFKWSPVKYVYEQWAGIYNKGNQHLYVNRGFGFLGYPGRLGILPEITVIELA
ncbi:MAG: metallophosphoesterase [Chitinophagales bacterium]|nr:metallophosphoesterase [Chitinophagaceae bacterium]MCB9065188.1 metallophosphoesterase [Chitinophagales bacterium]